MIFWRLSNYSTFIRYCTVVIIVAISKILHMTFVSILIIMQRVMQIAEESIPSSAENIALAMGAFCMVNTPKFIDATAYVRLPLLNLTQDKCAEFVLSIWFIRLEHFPNGIWWLWYVCLILLSSFCCSFLAIILKRSSSPCGIWWFLFKILTQKGHLFSFHTLLPLRTFFFRFIVQRFLSLSLSYQD